MSVILNLFLDIYHVTEFGLLKFQVSNTHTNYIINFTN
jgi:hypothetical protein